MIAAGGLLLVSSLGASLFWRALRPLTTKVTDATDGDSEGLSVIIPARNEARNLPKLLHSLRGSNVRDLLVVDDHSEDETAQVARSFGVRVVPSGALPEGWLGKPWACHQGAEQSQGDLLLFTDADTELSAPLIHHAVRDARAGAGLVSVVPTHQAVSGWEKLQGAFQLLLLVATPIRAAERGARAPSERLFCIGQFLLFRRDVYEAVGGHTAVRRRIAEDLAFARAVRRAGHRYRLLVRPGGLRVRMYPEGFGSFVAGWRRNFREGFRAASLRGTLEVGAVVGFLLGGPLGIALGWLGGDARMLGVAVLSYLLAVLLVARYQRRVGDFPSWSAAIYPLPVLWFTWVSLLALRDQVAGRPVEWRGRRFALAPSRDHHAEV